MGKKASLLNSEAEIEESIQANAARRGFCKAEEWPYWPLRALILRPFSTSSKSRTVCCDSVDFA